MYKVLFVDDEPEVLRAIARLLRRREPDWSCEFVHSGAEGLRSLSRAVHEAAPFDVVVADMRMPEMDGTTFLTAVREGHPQMIRIVLSGAADLEANLRVIPIAHQYLNKPLELPLLREAVVRSCDLRDILNNERLKEIVGEIDALPVCPTIYTQLTEALADPRSTMHHVGTIIEQDLAMSAKVLQMVNSAFFGTSISVTSVQQAVTFIGLPQIRQLTLVLEVFEAFEEPVDKKLRYYSMEYEREHALLTARIARELVDRNFSDHAFTAGVLHDIGKLVLATHMTDRFAVCFHRCLLEDRPIEDIEREELGTTHAEVGAYLLALWGLPDPVVEAVAFHHQPDRVRHSEFNVLSAIHVANYLADPRPLKPLYLRTIDNAYLERLGVEHKLEGWGRRATEILRAEVADDD